MTALISFPQVLGHEVVGVVERVGPAVKTRRVGERVVLNPWLSCAPRGLPLCEWCARGDYAQCRCFTRGALAAGIHHGNSAAATGGFAPLLPAHESQCIPVPEDVSDEAAVLADPFSVSLHAVLREPPPPGGTALVYGCGTLGLLAVAILRALHPSVRVLAVARFAHQAQLARRFGAERVLAHRPLRALIEALGEATGAALPAAVARPPDAERRRRRDLRRGGLGRDPRGGRPRRRAPRAHRADRRRHAAPLRVDPALLQGGGAGAARTPSGWRASPAAASTRWSGTSSWCASGGLDATALLTHRFPLARWRDALLACHDQGRSGAVKVVFEGSTPKGVSRFRRNGGVERTGWE